MPQELSALQTLHTHHEHRRGQQDSGVVPGALCTLKETCIGSVLDPCVSAYLVCPLIVALFSVVATVLMMVSS
jgi:hypothetical protein